MFYKVTRSCIFLLAVILFLTSCNFTERLRTQKRYDLNNNIASQSVQMEKEPAPLASIPTQSMKSNLTLHSNTESIYKDMELPATALTPPSVKLNNYKKQSEQLVTNREKLIRPLLLPVNRNSKKEDLRQHKHTNWGGSDSQILLIVLSFFLPPLAVYLYVGGINDHFWIDLVLTLLFFVPGIIYALLVVTGTI